MFCVNCFLISFRSRSTEASYNLSSVSSTKPPIRSGSTAVSSSIFLSVPASTFCLIAPRMAGSTGTAVVIFTLLMFFSRLYCFSNSVVISGRLLSRPFTTSSLIKAAVITLILFSKMVARITCFLSGLMMGPFSRLAPSRLQRMICCSTCISARTASIWSFSAARSPKDFAYQDARRGFCMLLVQFNAFCLLFNELLLCCFIRQLFSQHSLCYFDNEGTYLVLYIGKGCHFLVLDSSVRFVNDLFGFCLGLCLGFADNLVFRVFGFFQYLASFCFSFSQHVLMLCLHLRHFLFYPFSSSDRVCYRGFPFLQCGKDGFPREFLQDEENDNEY